MIKMLNEQSNVKLLYVVRRRLMLRKLSIISGDCPSSIILICADIEQACDVQLHAAENMQTV